MDNKINALQTQHFSIGINAPKEKVWKTMLDRDTYREWTSVFHEGSDYKGSWEAGSKILFLDPSGQGMVSKIAENKRYEFISIEHLGFVNNGEEDLESDGAKAFAGAHENYSFKEKNGVTEVAVDLEIPDKYEDMFEDMWPRALSKLKELSEK